MKFRRLAALILLPVGVAAAAFAAGRSIEAGRQERRMARLAEVAAPSAPLSIRSFDVVADHVARHGRQAVTLTVCNSTPRTVLAFESLSWQGGPLPTTVYADIPRRWAPGCHAEPLLVPVELEPRAYRLLVLERPAKGRIIWASSPSFQVTGGST